ncbi:mitochondrial sodium/calcium exchanger protein isoform X3 [Melanotaenia boesemani]|uniref:mitochondrial sodium/calcium exchanger protein isoform X3 n=1 Tax=Melanotaenia boesemani TaxID=1250792 RepID=UPI001C04ABE7|nr:mitochondrial sodium/calcium exchanger protein isoform X3 [Melanotaenia boesemani]
MPFSVFLLLGVALCSQGVASGSHSLRNKPGVGLAGQLSNTTMSESSSDECDLVMNHSAANRCAFVKDTPDCGMEDGFINYLDVAFCLLPPNLTPLTITLCVLWLLVLFVILGLTASKFFCPNLSAISSSLHLTHNVAGVTLLALGNGAPDIFSAIAAFSHPHTAGLAVGALFGAGIFVTTVVAGSVAMVKPFAVASRPFLRDIIFYMVAVFWTFLVLYRGTTTLGEILGYLGLYAVYVLTVIISAYIYSRQKNLMNTSVQNVPHIPAEFHSSDSSDDDVPYLASGTIQQEYESEYRPLLPYSESTSQILLSSLNPVDSRQWRRKSWTWRVLKVLKTPLEVLLLLCIPVVDPDKEDKNWRRPLNCFHLITAPLVCVLAFQSGKYCFSDITIARQGYPRMAISACFGGIIFNMLIGVGLGCLVQMVKTKADVQFDSVGLLTWILAGSLGLSLVLSFIIVPLRQFHLGRSYGIFLLVFYAIFLIIALLTEFGKIHT